MTTSEYCKPLAEINNELALKRHHVHQQSVTTKIGTNESRLNHSPLDSRMSDQLHDNNEQQQQQQQHNEIHSDSESCKSSSSGISGDSNSHLSKHDKTKRGSRVINSKNNHDTDSNGNSSSNNDDLHVYPNGWIPVMESAKVQSGKIKRGIIFGRDVIITRSDDGKEVSVLDAYCPHLGVHIGIGGKVKRVNNESCVECPFHGWTFRASDGQCVKIPYQKSSNSSKPASIPKQARLNTWTSVEVDNFIYVWHHIDRQPPSWHLVPSSELSLKNWQLIGRSCHTSNLDIRDMLENGADTNHFEGIHGDLFVFGGQLTELGDFNYLQKYFKHQYSPDWRPTLNDSGKVTHMAQFKLQSWISVFGLRVFDITVRANQIGPARVTIYYDSKWYGRGLLIMNSIPLGGRRTKYVQHIYTERSLFQCFMAKWVLYGEIKMLERDLVIWNHKKLVKNPIFIPEDKTLKQFRLWYSQFYKRKRVISIGSGDSVSKIKQTNVLDNDQTVKPCKGTIDF